MVRLSCFIDWLLGIYFVGLLEIDQNWADSRKFGLFVEQIYYFSTNVDWMESYLAIKYSKTSVAFVVLVKVLEGMKYCYLTEFDFEV